MYKNFDLCNLKLTIPETIIMDDCTVTFTMIGKSKSDKVSFYIQSCSVEDQIGRKFEAEHSDSVFGTITSSERKFINLAISREKKFSLTKGKMMIRILDGTNHQVIISNYSYSVNKVWCFDGVQVDEFKEQDITIFRMAERKSIIQKTDDVHNQKVVQATETFSLSNNELNGKEYSDFNYTYSDAPVINKYIKALQREMYYLKNNGGRKYKVTNGKFISTVMGRFAYVFELETELHISDTAPVVINAGLRSVNGEVLICEDFNLTLLLNENLGEFVSTAYITVEPWKLLQALINKIALIGNGHNHPIARKLIQEGPCLTASNKSIKDIIQGQENAKEFAKRNPITIIWGPPGTGKTYTMSQLAIDFMRKGKKVLIVSHSNVSVDGVIKKIYKMASDSDNLDMFRSGSILRYGYVRDDDLSKNKYATSFNYTIQNLPKLNEEKEKLEEKKHQLINENRMNTQEGIEVEKKLQLIRNKVQEFEKSAVRNAKIIATTISKVTIDKIFDNECYDVVMFDEASMAYVPQIFAAASMARENFICVGDFFQLPAIAQSEDKDTLQEDIFSFLNIVDELGNVQYHPWLVMLNVQRRMHPIIAEFSNKYLYYHLLKNDEHSVNEVMQITNRVPFETNPLILFDLAGTYCAAYKNSDNSRFNILSAFIAFYTSISAEKIGGSKAGIISPYAAQMRLIRAMILDYNNQVDNKTKVICSTVHQFQGSESDVIIFDAVESFPSQKPGWLMTKNDNYNVTRLINVAVTRARGKLITISNNRFWERKLNVSQHAYNNLIKFSATNGKTLSRDHLKEYLSKIIYGAICFYSEIKEYEQKLLKDIKKAKERIIISLPTGNLDEYENTIVYNSIRQAIENNITVLVKTNDYVNLTADWKCLARPSENAVFPLIIIDNKITWYGVLGSKASFIDKDMHFLIACNLVVRFQGEHTAEIINSLSELDKAVIGESKVPLVMKYGDMSGTKKETGLSDYILSRYHCPECGNPLTLKHGNSSGKFYIGCTGCKHIEYLTADIINDYIDKYRIKCSHHHCNIEARLGQFGVYIQCNEGIERHYIKLNEI